MEEGKWLELKYSRIQNLRAARPQERTLTIFFLRMKKLSLRGAVVGLRKQRKGVAKSEENGPSPLNTSSSHPSSAFELEWASEG